MSAIRQGSPGFRRPGSVSFTIAPGAGHQLIYRGLVLDINELPIPFAQCQLSMEAIGAGPITGIAQNLGLLYTQETGADFSEITFQTDIKGEFEFVVTFTAAQPTPTHYLRAHGGESDAGAASKEPIP